jgi:signal transduction histidine kinase
MTGAHPSVRRTSDAISAPIVVSQLGTSREAKVERAARPVTALAATLALVALAGAIAAPVVDHRGDLATLVVRSIVVVSFAVAGAMAQLRRPTERQPILVLLGAALGGLATVLAAVIEAHALGQSVGSGILALARVGEPLALALLPIAVMHFLLGLPDGSCRLGRSVTVAGYVAGAAVGVAVWTQHPSLPLWPFAVELVVVVPIGIVGSQRRYTRSTGLERQRMQWFGWAVSLGAETLLVALALHLLWGWPDRAPLVVDVSALPLAVAVAMGSSRRFAGRIDRILAQTVSFAGLTGVVVIVYVVIVVGLGRTPTHADRSLLALSMVAAAVAALLYGPARQRLTQYANRIVYGEREAPDTVLRTFGSRLSRAIPMDELLLQVAESLRKTLALTAAEVWTGSGGRLERSISVPDSPVTRLALTGEEESVVARAGVTGTAWLEIWLPALLEGRHDSVVRVAPTIHSGHVLGLIVAVRPPGGDQFTVDDDTMLTELARQVGLALHNVELDSALQESLDEVRRQADELQASRARIVAASDAARRQIERNLHDGAQQHLVALAVNVRLARKLADTDAEASLEILDQLGDELQDAVQELRALAHGIYPPLLIDRGIEEALRSAAGRAALPTELDAAGLDRHSPDEEAAVYFCCMEALQNAGKHAGEGATATVRVWQDAAGLSFEVTDTGAGFVVDTKQGQGAGFVNMSDRVGAIGGTLHVTSAPGEGTTVTGRIPISAART